LVLAMRKANFLKQGYIVIRYRNVYIGVNLLVPLAFALSFISGVARLYLSTMLSLSIHETGHIIVALWLGKTVSEIKVLPYGFSASLNEKTHSFAESLAVYSGGPAISILLFAVLKLGAASVRHWQIAYAANINLLIAVINMLPVMPLDGGKLLREFLGITLGMNSAVRLMRLITLAGAAAAAAASVAAAAYGQFNPGLWAAVLFIITSSRKEITEGRVMSLKNILYRRLRLERKGVYPVRHLAALPAVKLGEIINKMDYDRFHIVYALDSDTVLKGEYTEQQIIDGALKYGSNITLQEFSRKIQGR
jgi:stage IV sporulation protein FB